MAQRSVVFLMFWITTAAATAATEKPQDLTQNIAEIRATGTMANETLAKLVVQNSASFTVHLVSCAGENYTLPGGGSASLPVAGLLGFWVVPDKLKFDCFDGPFGFYVGATVNDTEQVMGVSFGVDEPGVEAGSLSA